MAAVAIAHKKTGDLKTYFERKVAEGKNKMTVLNAVRAKLVARMFAVIRNNRVYQPILSVQACTNHKNIKLIPKHTSGSPIKALKLSPKDVRNLNKATSIEGYGDKVITDEYGNFIPASEIYKYGIVNSSGNMEGFIPEILVSPKYSITKEDLKPKLYSGNIANHPDANNSMTDWFKVISYLTPNNKRRFLNL